MEKSGYLKKYYSFKLSLKDFTIAESVKEGSIDVAVKLFGDKYLIVVTDN